MSFDIIEVLLCHILNYLSLKIAFVGFYFSCFAVRHSFFAFVKYPILELKL